MHILESSSAPYRDPRMFRAVGALFKFIPSRINGFALIESVAFLSVLVLCNILFGDGTRFIHMSLHPFWIIVLFITVQYGPGEALMAALLSGVFLLAGNFPEQHFSEGMYAYLFRVMYLPFLWVVTALVLGGIRSRQLQEKKSICKKLEKHEEAVKAIVNGYNVMKQAKEQLEMRLAHERCSVLSVYNIAQALETVDPANVHMEVARLVQLVFNPRKFSIFVVSGGSLILKVSHGWESRHDYMAQFSIGTAFHKHIVGHAKFLNITSSRDETVLGKQGMLAGPILDPRTGRVFGMLKIEDMAFMELDSRAQEIFRIVCKWAGRIYGNVERYKGRSAPLSRYIPASPTPLAIAV